MPTSPHTRTLYIMLAYHFILLQYQPQHFRLLFFHSTLQTYVYTLARRKLRFLMLKLMTTLPLESYTVRQGKVWAVICHPGKPFIIIILKGCDN